MTHLTTVIPVYNGECFIRETLRSVARQIRKPDRLIVIDNRSTDRTQAIVKEFMDLPIEWIQNEKNLGLFGNLNRALEFAAQTEFFHLLHADDLILPEFYSRLMEGVQPGRALIFCQSELIDENGNLISAPQKTEPRQPKQISVQNFIADRAELKPFYFPSVLLKTDGQPSPCQFRLDMPQLADMVFWAEWASHCERIFELPMALCQYRLHGGSDTAKNKNHLQSWVLDEWRAMRLISERLGLTPAKRSVFEQKLKIIFAARTRVKIKTAATLENEFARLLPKIALPITGRIYWHLGCAAVAARDFLSR
jgi:glycosyltransferase involved in cell wall biosynthesis